MPSPSTPTAQQFAWHDSKTFKDSVVLRSSPIPIKRTSKTHDLRSDSSELNNASGTLQELDAQPFLLKKACYSLPDSSVLDSIELLGAEFTKDRSVTFAARLQVVEFDPSSPPSYQEFYKFDKVKTKPKWQSGRTLTMFDLGGTKAEEKGGQRVSETIWCAGVGDLSVMLWH